MPSLCEFVCNPTCVLEAEEDLLTGDIYGTRPPIEAFRRGAKLHQGLFNAGSFTSA